MNLSKEIKKIVTPSFLELGFEYTKTRNSWLFSRKVGHAQQSIEFETSGWHKNAFRVNYYTSSRYVQSYYFIDQRDHEWHSFEDEESLRQELLRIVNITKEYALDWFEKNTIQPKIVFNYKWVFNEQSIANAKVFIEQNKLDVNDPETIKRLEGLLKEVESEETWINSAYYLGELFRVNLSGEWLIKENKFPVVINLGGIVGFEIEPHNLILSFINNPNGVSLYNTYISKAQTVKSILNH
ncbi:hypothetical protein K0T92_07365 [Paenibacillus oenotherae]|uniref:DUF4304 domain-containing protein n=1 Tax=Paenibacillus oenotherae TaxID=1435645 RepID=A0ABS7D3P9_9BACL|nr:hypothetical protein [Paenibacillus oenotherae]MBW7474560.1 hypothetical protein [Paenibacillus oenotherae]